MPLATEKILETVNHPRQRTYMGRVVAVVSVLLAGVLLGGCGGEPVRPGVGDHWHVAYGFYVCDEYVGILQGDLTGVKEDGRPESKDYGIIGVHSHNDGLIHFHPYSGLAAGPKANLGLFLYMYKIGISNEQIDLPEYLGGSKIEYVSVCETPSGQVDAELRVQYWPNASNLEQYETFTENFTDIPLTQDGAAIAIVFAPEGVQAPIPPSVGAPITDIPGGGSIGGPAGPTSTVPSVAPSTTQP